MSTNHPLFWLHPFSPVLNPLFSIDWDGLGACPVSLFSLPLVGDACLSGQLSVRSGARHYTQKFVWNCRDLVFLLSATLSEHGLHWDSPRLLPLLAHQHPQEYIPAAPVTQCPPVTMLNWGTLTQMVLHTSTSSQVRFFTEMPRAQLSHPSSWHAGPHKLWAHIPCCSSKDHQ